MSGRDFHEASQDDSVLVVYVEPLLRERRVLFIGDASGDALRRVVRSASRVVAFDTAKGARRGRLPKGVIEPYDPFEVEALDLQFDAVIVPNLLELGPTLEERLDDFARMLGRRGHLVAGLPVASRGLDHEELWDLLAVRFDAVRLAGTARIAAVAVAELGPETVQNVVVDGSLVTEPARTLGFIAVAGQTDPETDGYLLVQLDAPKGEPGADPKLAQRARELEKEVVALAEAVAEARNQAAQTKVERDALREERKRAERELRDARDVETKLRGRLGELEETLRSVPSGEDLAKVEERASAQVARLRELELEVERRGRLVRHLVEETHDRTLVSAADVGELDRAVERALRAEAEREAAVFLVDELRARLADHTDAGVEAMREREADLAGRVRGMRARIAELEDRVAQSEVAAASAKAAARAEAAAGGSVAERQLSGQVGQLLGQLMVARERELDAKNGRDIARSENLALVAQVGALETQHKEMRDRTLARVDRICRADEPSPSLELALERLEALVESLRGECVGLRLRAQSLEAATPASTTIITGSAGGAAQERSAELEALVLENQALAADLAEAKSEARLAVEGTTATRDALVERLQLELAENERRALLAEERERSHAAEVGRLRVALVEAAGGVDERDTLARRLEQMERDLRDAIAAAERAAEDAREHAVRAEASETRLRAAEADARETRAALAETRSILDELRAVSDRTGGYGVRSDLAAELGSADERGGRMDESEKDVLLRSLTAQLEERDDRIRALERRMSGGGNLPAGDAEALQRELLGLQERATRLADELSVEREARRVAEERAASTFGTAGGAAQRELERRAETQQRELDEAQVRLESFERDVRALREVFVETRTGLEHLLGASSGGGDPALVERIGELLTLLGRY